jgi:RNA polymerase sigma-32 factor
VSVCRETLVNRGVAPGQSAQSNPRSVAPRASSLRSFASYREAIARYAQLSAEEERDLAVQFRKGDRRAGEQLIAANLPFVLHIAREYRCWGAAMEDIVQQGNLGLLKAALRFDPDRGCRLVTYASYWVRAEIREFVVRSYRIVRLGTTKAERRALRIYRKTRETDPAVLSKMSGLDAAAVERLLPIVASRDTSVDQTSPSGAAPLDRMAAPEADPEERALHRDHEKKARAEIASFLRAISARERTILRARWLRDEPLTLESLGRRFGISKERVRQLEERTIARLKDRLLTCPGLAEAS